MHLTSDYMWDEKLSLYIMWPVILTLFAAVEPAKFQQKLTACFKTYSNIDAVCNDSFWPHGL